MPLIDSSYFDIPERNIPNTGSAGVLSKLNSLIVKYEKDFLIKSLGYELFLLFEDGLDVGSGDTPDQEWLNIRDGVEFYRYGKKTKWYGLINAVTKDSPIADYVYWHWLEHNHTQTSSLGEVKTKAENADTVSPAKKMAKVWNDMSAKMLVLDEYLRLNSAVYPAYYPAYPYFGYTYFWGGNELATYMNPLF